MSLGKNENRVEIVEHEVHPLTLRHAYAGWIVSTTLTPDQFAALPEAHQALAGQSASRVPALLLEAQTAGSDETVRTTYIVNRAELAGLILELVGTFLNREMFKQLVAALPEEWSR